MGTSITLDHPTYSPLLLTNPQNTSFHNGARAKSNQPYIGALDHLTGQTSGRRNGTEMTRMGGTLQKQPGEIGIPRVRGRKGGGNYRPIYLNT